MSSTVRPRPVLIYTAVVVGLQTFLALGGSSERIDEDVLWWLQALLAVGSAVGGALLQGVVTPLSDPMSKDGRPLIPAPPATVPLARVSTLR